MQEISGVLKVSSKELTKLNLLLTSFKQEKLFIYQPN